MNTRLFPSFDHTVRVTRRTTWYKSLYSFSTHTIHFHGVCAHHKFLLWYFSVSPLWGSLATLVTAAEAIEYYCNSYWPTTPHGYCWINSVNNYTVLLLSDGDCALFKCENTPHPPHASCFQRLALFFRYVFFSRDVLLLSPLTGRCESVNGLPRWGIDTNPKPWVSRTAQP